MTDLGWPFVAQAGIRMRDVLISGEGLKSIQDWRVSKGMAEDEPFIDETRRAMIADLVNYIMSTTDKVTDADAKKVRFR